LTLRRHRWSQLEVKKIPYLASTTKPSPDSWTPEAIVNFIRDPRAWQALLTADDCKVTQWHRRVEELIREPSHAGKGKKKKKLVRKDKRECKIVAHIALLCGPGSDQDLQEQAGIQAACSHDPEHPKLLGGPW
jgi:hypothetical protein